jgi:HlyD family secretion protein
MVQSPIDRSGLCAALALGLTLSCSGGDSERDARTAPVERRPIERIVVATGTIEPEHEVEVRPRISGIVDEIHVDAGDRVEEGQPLLELDRELLEVRAREARAKLDATQVEARFARTAYKRSAELRKQAATAEREHEDATLRIESALARVAEAQAAMDSLEVQLRYATVTSPFGGKVLDVFVEEGSAVSAVTSVTGGTPLLSLAAADKLHLAGLIDENEVARVTVGQPARIRTEAYRDRIFTGRLREIAPLGERRENVTYFEVEIEITDADRALLRPRMSGDGEIVTETIEDALVIPETALLYDGSRLYVEVLQKGANPVHFERRDISIGIVENDRVQVLDGLEAGEEVRVH